MSLEHGVGPDVHARAAAPLDVLAYDRGQLRALLDSAGLLVARVDAGGALLAASDAWLAVMGAPGGRALASLVDPDDLPSIEALLAGAGAAARELRARGRHGYRVLRCSASRDAASGDLLVVASDITDLRAAEQAANAARERAEHASRVKSRFLANMSHEIRTPMNAVLGMTSLALDTSLTAEQRDYLESVHGSAESLLAIINDILDISKIEAGKLTLEEVEFELRDVLKEAVTPLAARAAQKGLDFSVQVTADVADSVRGDPVRFRQILVNLASNAIKFTDRGAVRVTVTRDVVDPQLVEVTVADTGIGIPLDKQDVIFEPFLQADDSTTRHFGGTGLGLSICKELAALMGGRVWVTSEPGRGSRFVFTVRLANTAYWFNPKLAPSAEELRPLAGPPREQATLRVLLAEDNLMNAKLAVHLLRREGCEVEHVVNGQLAVERAATGTFDLVLMDMQMPVLDGVEATRAIRADEVATGAAHLPIVALTANAMKDDELACRSAGMDDFLAKPVERGLLHNVIERVRASAPVRAPRPVTAAPSKAEVDVDVPALFAGCDHDAELVREVVDVFRQGWREAYERVATCARGGSAVEVRAAAHFLKGSARALHATRVARICAAMEDAAREGEVGPTLRELPALSHALERLDAVLARPLVAPPQA